MTGLTEKQTQKQEQSLSAASVSRWPSPLRALIEVLSSLKLTVVLLSLSLLLVFIGTLAQVDEGLYNAQARYFRSFFIWWSPAGASWKLPIFPGGYLVGGLLLANLFAAHARRFKFSRKKIGIFIIHAGLVSMLLGQLGTDLFSNESVMQLFEGDSKNYSEESRGSELAIIDATGEKNRVYSIPQAMVAHRPEIRDARLPFSVRVKNYWPNAAVFPEPPIKANIPEGALKPEPSDGALRNRMVLPQAVSTDPDTPNIPAAVVEIEGERGPVASFLVSSGSGVAQEFAANGRKYNIALRLARHYYPFSVTLLKATHENYRGTDLPKNFASVVRIENPDRGEARETKIYMNNPLRYEGLTFFQYQMAADEMAVQKMGRASSTFQVVRNPSWITPYLSCIMVGSGLIIQFMTHLVGFVTKRRSA